jgi:hypothetical protein
MNTPKRFWIIPAGLLATGLLLGGLMFSRPSLAAPGVTWSPGSISDTVSPGQQQTIPLSFTASANLTNVVVRVVPALQGLVQVTPSSLAAAQKGQTIHLTLTVAPSASAPLVVTQGTIQVHVGTATIAQPLSVQIIVASNAVGLLPPDPGAAGMATLEGIDSDGDGVRDDVERYIWLTYPQSARQRAALFQEAIAFQNLVVGGATAQNNLQQVDQADDCLSYTFMTGDGDVGGGLRAKDADEALTAVVMNTPSRVKAYAQANAQFSGTVTLITHYAQKGLHCQIPPASLPN